MHEIISEALNALILLSSFASLSISFPHIHTYIRTNLYTNVQHTYLYCFIFELETYTQAVIQRVHAWMCPKWLNRILLSLKMCEYATKPNDCMTWQCKEVLTSWYVLKCYRQFLLKMVVLMIILLNSIIQISLHNIYRKLQTIIFWKIK